MQNIEIHEVLMLTFLNYISSGYLIHLWINKIYDLLSKWKFRYSFFKNKYNHRPPHVRFLDMYELL